MKETVASREQGARSEERRARKTSEMRNAERRTSNAEVSKEPSLK